MANKGSTLLTGQYLTTNDYLVSNNGKYSAIMQGDGNFVLYRGNDPAHLSNPFWASNTNSAGGQFTVIVQGDGNFVLYKGNDPAHLSSPFWASNTAQGGSNQYFVALQDDGNLVLYRGTPSTSSTPLWASNTYWASQQVNAVDRLQNGQWLINDSYLLSENGSYAAYLQGDANFVLCYTTQTTPHIPDLSRPYWSIASGATKNYVAAAQGGHYLARMQDDGNFVFYNGSDIATTHGPYWASNTAQSHPGQYTLVMQNDGNLVLYRSSDSAVLWASNSNNPQRLDQLKTQMNGFDTVVAITQKAINSQLKNLMWVKDALQKQWIVEATDADGNVYGTLTANISAPRIIVNTQQFLPHTVIFLIPFKSGTLQRWKGFGPSATQVTTPFGAGDLAFQVNLNLQDVDSANVPDQVKSALASIKNLGPGMFSIRQLLVDLENANLAEYEGKHTTLPTEIASDNTLQVGLQQTFKRLHEQGGNILGYTIRVNNPNDVNPVVPSFPPTDLNFATHVSGVSSANSDMDTLDYLVMTQHHPLPTTALPVGDFVTDPSSNGTMAIARSVFFDSYLIPKIAGYTNITFNLSVNKDDVNFSINSQANKPFTKTATGWNYQTSNDQTSSYDLRAATPAEHQYKISHTCNVTATPESNTVLISGITSVYSHLKVWWGSKEDWASSITLTSTLDQTDTISWTITITLNPAGNGEQLIGTVTSNFPPTVHTTNENNLAKFDEAFKSAIYNKHNDTSKQLSNMLTSIDLNQIATNLGNALSDQRNYFIFPGADSFFFKDPFFNTESDLLVAVTYNFY